MSGSALAELWEALGELLEGLYEEKLTINRTSDRYVNQCWSPSAAVPGDQSLPIVQNHDSWRPPLTMDHQEA